MKTKIEYFVHETTVDNAAEKCSGWKQVELTELGKKRATRLGEICKDMQLDVVFTSDLTNLLNK